MRACARAKWRFQRSADVVSLRDGSKNRDFVGLPLPCFVPGCDAFGLKIATAALRPRNDTKMERFMLGKHTFLFYEVIFARCCSASFFKRFVPKNVPFFSKTCQICHCEEGACARRGNLKRSETASRNEARQGCAVKFGRWPSMAAR